MVSLSWAKASCGAASAIVPIATDDSRNSRLLINLVSSHMSA
jgi:hypothetical protein